MKVRSARGEMVDFALLEMKSKLVNTVPSAAVVQRKKKIESTPVYVEESDDQDEVQQEKLDDGIVNKRKARSK